MPYTPILRFIFFLKETSEMAEFFFAQFINPPSTPPYFEVADHK